MQRSKCRFRVAFNFERGEFRLYRELDEVRLERIGEVKVNKVVFNALDVCRIAVALIDMLLKWLEEKFLAEARRSADA